MNRCSNLISFMTLAVCVGAGAKLYAGQTPSGEKTVAIPVGQRDSAGPTSQMPQSSGDSPLVIKGTTLVAEMSHGLNAKKLKAGDKVKAVLTQDLVLKGKIVAPNESKLVGHVAEVMPSSDAHPDSHLCVVFDKVLLKHHRQLELQAGVQALLAPVIRRSRVDEPDQMMPPTVTVSGSSNTSGGRGSGVSRSGPSGSTTSSVAALNSIGAMPTVQSTPGSSSPGSSVTPIDLKQINLNKLSASNGMRGVYGIKGISLSPKSDGAATIISKNANVKLENGTQMILVVLQ
jgi:hypothetical protein